MKNKSIAVVSGILFIVVLFASAALADEKESPDDILKQFFESQKTQLDTIVDDPAAMKEYVISQKDVNVRYGKGNTLLHYAANRGYRDIVELLLKKGANINAGDNDNRTPLHEAMAYRRYDVAR
ncbi:MAG: ankyrin repeat domain-containing protein, partial [Syntrophaceae bacterium]